MTGRYASDDSVNVGQVDVRSVASGWVATIHTERGSVDYWGVTKRQAERKANDALEDVVG